MYGALSLIGAPLGDGERSGPLVDAGLNRVCDFRLTFNIEDYVLTVVPLKYNSIFSFIQ